MSIELIGETAVGRVRDHNEDSLNYESLTADTALVVVADGMGGHRGGKQASQIAVETFSEAIRSGDWRSHPETQLHTAVSQANEAIRSRASENPELADMGTTLVGGLVTDEEAILANVGDSRGYHIDEEINQLTTDQSVAQTLTESGELTPEEADDHPMSNVLEQSLGTDETVDPELVHAPISGHLLLCSDGLTDELTNNQIATLIRESEFDRAAGTLVEAADNAGGNDNISVVLARSQKK